MANRAQGHGNQTQSIKILRFALKRCPVETLRLGQPALLMPLEAVLQEYCGFIDCSDRHAIQSCWFGFLSHSMPV